MNKKNIIIIVLIILLACVCFAIGVVLLDDGDTSSKVKFDGEYKQFNTIDVSECSHKKCNKDYKFNGNTFSVITDENLNYQIRYNKKLVSSFSEMPFLGDTIYTFDDLVLYTSYYSDYSMLVNVYNPKTKENMNFQLSDEGQWYTNEIEVEDNKIIFHVSRFDDPLYFIDVKNQIPIVMDNCENYRSYADEEAAKTFEITYKDGSFGKAKEIETKTLKEYKEYHALCNE